jgi:hypothetical protein
MKKSLRFFCREPSLRVTVKRMDTHGNIFTVKEGMTYNQAKLLADHMESLGHKQTYWVEEDKTTIDKTPKDNSAQNKS